MLVTNYYFLLKKDEKLVGKIDFLGNNGEIMETEEYHDMKDFEDNVLDCDYSGVPIEVTIFTDREYNFLNKISCPGTKVKRRSSQQWITVAAEFRGQAEDVANQCGINDYEEVITQKEKERRELTQGSIKTYIVCRSGESFRLAPWCSSITDKLAGLPTYDEACDMLETYYERRYPNEKVQSKRL